VRYAVDIGIVLLFVVNIILGLRYGVVVRAFALAGLYGGVALATFAGNALERFFHGTGTDGDLYANAATYLATVFTVVLMMEILGFLYRDRVRSVISLAFDRVSGAVLGGFVAFVEVAVVVLVMLAVGHSTSSGLETLPNDRAKASNAVADAYLGGHVAGAQTFMDNLLGRALPSDLGAHLAEATR
jgi:uncharacterized membrane protein required for colicin V production